MRKIILALSLLAVAGTASAQWHHRHHGYHGPSVVYRDSWVAPLILGGIAGAVIANNRQTETVIIQQQPSVVVQRQVVCTEWKEIQQPDGQIYRERTCTQ
jgi:hypothetical protein